MVIEAQLRAKGKYFNKKLKAQEVLRLYADGERNFQGAILRGQSFKGQDISGADFSEADIRSANFSRAKLVEVDFAGAKCGLQKRWALLLVFLSWIIALISVLIVWIFALILRLDILLDPMITLISLIVFAIYFIFIIRQGVKALAGATIVALVVVLTFSVGGGGGASGLLAGIAAITGAFAFAVGGIKAGVGAFALVGATVGGLIGIETPDLAAEIGKGFISGIWAGCKTIFFLKLSGLAGDSENLYISFAIPFSTIKGTNFRNADLTDANFSRARLKSTNLRKAILTRVSWYKSTMLDFACSDNGYLKNTSVKQLMLGEKNTENFDNQRLREINLRGINLSDVNFSSTDLSRANLQNANLSRAKIIGTKVDGTDFTGSCIENWNINRETHFDKVICEYIYLKEKWNPKTKKHIFLERRPSDPNRNFKPGEFAQLVEKSVETVDLIFSNGIDWKAFLSSFQDLQVEYGDQNVSIQAIEKKSDGAFVIRLNVPPEADKAEIESKAKQSYETQLNLLEAQYREKLKAKDDQIATHRQYNTDLLDIIKLKASQPITENNFYGPVGSVDNKGTQINVAGEVKGNQNS